MRPIVAFHVLAGALGLLSGFLALASVKGMPLHRRSGMVFVWTMLAMCAAGLVLTLASGIWVPINGAAALLTAYLVTTSLTTVRPPAAHGRTLHAGLMTLALVIGTIELGLGLTAVGNGGRWRGIPAFPFFLFALVGLVGGGGDLRVLRSGALTGSARLARHLWRMSFALFIAAMSFFLGQAKVIPKPMRIMPLLAMPPLIVLVAMVYWLWRVRSRRARGRMVVAVPDVALPEQPLGVAAPTKEWTDAADATALTDAISGRAWDWRADAAVELRLVAEVEQETDRKAGAFQVVAELTPGGWVEHLRGLHLDDELAVASVASVRTFVSGATPSGRCSAIPESGSSSHERPTSRRGSSPCFRRSQSSCPSSSPPRRSRSRRSTCACVIRITCEVGCPTTACRGSRRRTSACRRSGSR